ncbi:MULTISPECIES: hypothetical protein [unclassified Paenibacillus]|uniref:hypothetical protein n=1 Tax=unclassified Paenibacillus TaxID=185978 RepID=UPI00041A8AFE|nr:MULTISPECIES: hypothetical protein [unclassified Paenibacillus]KGP85285.1 hypothetical protein P364_0101315 [Paenibacillus sp. MAEPY2]KGP88142.1 hypothetical protein P363_0108250 [Paenibacillus sp. MAEPY1]
MNYKKVEEVNAKRLALANEMMILAAKVSPAMDLEEMDVIQTEIALLREQHDALPTLEDIANERLISEKLIDLVYAIDEMMIQTGKLIETLDENHPHRISLNGEVLGLRRAQTAVRKFHTGNIKGGI